LIEKFAFVLDAFLKSLKSLKAFKAEVGDQVSAFDIFAV